MIALRYIFQKSLTLLFPLFIEIIPTTAQSIFSLKDKHIMLSSNDVTLTFPTVDKGCKYEYYLVKAFDINECNNKHLYKKSIVGEPLYVYDIYATYNKSGKPQKLYLFLKGDVNNYILQVSLGKTYYDVSRKFYVSPEHISIKYYDLDEITAFQRKMKDSLYYYPNSNVKCKFLNMKFNGSSMYYEYSQGNETKQKLIECYATNTQYEKTPLERCFSNISFEKDLISKCKQSIDSVLINDFITKFANKEIYIKEAYGGFYQCEKIEIANTGYRSPNYEYTMWLNQNGREEKLSLTENRIKNIVLADEYREEKRLLKEKEEREEQEQQEMLAREEAHEKTRLIKKYGKYNTQLILDEKVAIGFTKEMCIEAWGEPQDINRTITRNKVYEQWVYGIGCYLYFEGNYLTTIQN